MAFEEIFNPGAAYLRDQRNIDKVTGPSVVVAGAPPLTPPDGIAIPLFEELEPFGEDDGEDSEPAE